MDNDKANERETQEKNYKNGRGVHLMVVPKNKKRKKDNDFDIMSADEINMIRNMVYGKTKKSKFF